MSIEIWLFNYSELAGVTTDWPIEPNFVSIGTLEIYKILSSLRDHFISTNDAMIEHWLVRRATSNELLSWVQTPAQI